MARPIVWDEDKKSSAIKLIFDRISNGDSVRKILNSDRDNKNLPSRRVFNEWLSNDDQLSTQYAHACDVRAEQIFEDILQIADDQEKDFYTDDDGREFVNHNVINRARLRVDSRKWILSKLNPKKYSDKIQVDQSEFVTQPLFELPKKK